MERITINQRRAYVRKYLWKKDPTEMAEYAGVSEKTITRDIDVIVEYDISRIRRSSILHKTLKRLEDIRLRCITLSEETNQDSVRLGAIKTEMEIALKLIDVLQSLGAIDKAPERKQIDVKIAVKKLLESIEDKPKKIVIKDEDLK